MTNLTAWLAGNFGITAIFVAYYLSLTIWGQWKIGPRTWADSKPNRLAISMVLFLVGCALFIVAAATSHSVQPTGWPNYAVWGGWATLWFAALTALTALGRVGPAIAANGLWALYIVATRLAL